MADTTGKEESKGSADPKKKKADEGAGSKDLEGAAAPAKKRRRRRPRRKKKPATSDAKKTVDTKQTAGEAGASKPAKKAAAEKSTAKKPAAKKSAPKRKQDFDMGRQRKSAAKEDEEVVKGAYDYVQDQESQEGVYSMDESGQYLSGEGSDITVGEKEEPAPPIDVGKMSEDSVGEEAEPEEAPQEDLQPEEAPPELDAAESEVAPQADLQPEEAPPELDAAEPEVASQEDFQPEEVPPELDAEEPEEKKEEESVGILSVKPAQGLYPPGPGMDSMPDAFKDPGIVQDAETTPVESSYEPEPVREPEPTPAREPEPEPEPVFGPEPTREPEPAPALEPEPEPESQPAFEPEPDKMGNREVFDQPESGDEEEFSDASELDEPKTVLDSLAYVGMQIWPILGRVFNFKIIFSIVALVGVIWGGLWVYNSGFFGNLIGEMGEEEGETVPSTVVVTDSSMRENGVASAVLFGGNAGSRIDFLESQIQLSHYFGNLLEPQVSGETGISAALYYGELMDEASIVNQYVEFVKGLEELQNLYEIDVYELLDQTDERSVALDSYISQLEEAKDKNEKSLQLLNLYVDDLKESYNSLSPDKTQYEQDFFVALESLEAEKSDSLLKSFIDVSQKQSALKARVAALDKLVSYYESALKKLDRRMDAVDKNKEALIEGIRVVDVPGGGVDVIIEPN